MPATCEISEAQEQDLPEIMRLLKELSLSGPPKEDMDHSRAIFRKLKTYPDYRVYIARDAGRAVGTFALMIVDELAKGGLQFGLVEDVVVHPEHRSQGLGQRMIRFAMELCHAKGCYKMMLSSHVSRKRAHDFYRDLGFEEYGICFSVPISMAPTP